MSRRILRVVGRMLLPLAAAASLLCGFARQSDDPIDWSVPQWVAWRDGQIRRLLEPTFSFKGGKLIDNNRLIALSLEPYELVANCRRRDRDFFKAGTPRGQAMANFVRFVTAQHWAGLAEPHGLGLTVSDKAFADQARESIRIPELLQSPKFLHCLTDPSGYAEAFHMIEEHNAGLAEEARWIALPFESRFIKSADQATYGRLLVVVPGNPDMWVNFALALPGGDSKTVTSVSIVAASKGVTWTADFTRESNESGFKVVPMAAHNPDPSDNCYDCHKSAAMPIHPDRVFGFDPKGTLVSMQSAVPELLNARIRSYGLPSTAMQDSGAYGPSAGSTGVTRSDEFVRDASEMDLSQESVARVRNAMKCGSCHEDFARLNFPQPLTTSRDVRALKTHRSLMQTYIEEGWMPPRNDLTTEERTALWRCLSKEYLDPGKMTGAFVDWLKGER